MILLMVHGWLIQLMHNHIVQQPNFHHGLKLVLSIQ